MSAQARPKVVGIIQARMGSTRLPGKVLADIEGEPMLVRTFERSRRASSLDDLVIATTDENADAPVAGLCQERGYSCFRGHPTDVLDRYYQAAKAVGAEVIVRITADCPLMDPEVVDRTVEAFLEAHPEVDFVANRWPAKRTYPIGLDVEVCSFEALERAWMEAPAGYAREHVMPYLYEVEGRFRTRVIDCEQDLGGLRWTVDTPEDLAFVREVYRAFQGRDDFSWCEVLGLLERRPDLAAINADVPQKSFRAEG